MIYISLSRPVNEPDQPVLDRDAVWQGLLLKANNALPFVPSMTECTVTQRLGDTVFDRDIVFRGAPFTERISLFEPQQVVFTRIAGPVLGTIANSIEGADDALELRFSFALVVTDVIPGSPEEKEYADGMTADYLKAVDSTLAAMRKIAAGADAGADAVTA